MRRRGPVGAAANAVQLRLHADERQDPVRPSSSAFRTGAGVVRAPRIGAPARTRGADTLRARIAAIGAVGRRRHTHKLSDGIHGGARRSHDRHLEASERSPLVRRDGWVRHASSTRVRSIGASNRRVEEEVAEDHGQPLVSVRDRFARGPCPGRIAVHLIPGDVIVVPVRVDEVGTAARISPGFSDPLNPTHPSFIEAPPHRS